MDRQKLINIENRLKEQMPFGAKYIMNKLKINGFESFIVGGCVRDAVINELYPELNVKVDDIDITTNALPEDIKKIFSNHTLVLDGEKNGTIKVYIEEDKDIYDVTTFRGDGEYSDGRHPDSVIFNVSLEEDLSRRDATMNAIAFNETFVDPFKGIDDIEQKIIRAVGDPTSRVIEDSLRMLRYIRFAAQKGFKIEKETLNAIKENAELIQKVSMERIRNEIIKILKTNKAAEGIKQLYDSKLSKYIIPELNKVNLQYINILLKNTSNNFILRLSALLYGINKNDNNNDIKDLYQKIKSDIKIANQILIKLKFDNKTISIINKLIRNYPFFTELNDKEIKKLINKIGKDNIYILIDLMIANRYIINDIYYKDIKSLENKINNIISNNMPLIFKDLALNGHDLKKLGFKQGKEIKFMLNILLDKVLTNPDLNTKEKLINIITNFQKQTQFRIL